MSHEKLRRQILYATARLLITQQETQVGRARIQAARKLYKGWVKPADMPTDREIHAELDRMSNFHQPAPEDRFVLFRQLLVALEKVQQSPKKHTPREMHSPTVCRVYDLVYDEVPYDEELLLAALLHDVGKGIDPHNHVEAGLGVLGETITERTAWLITHCHEARKVKDGTIGVRARRRLQDSGELRGCDTAG